MPWICTPAFPAGCAPGVKSGPWFHPDMWDEPVPLTVQRRRLDPGATDRIPLRGRENFGYVIAGTAGALAAPEAEGERFTLGPESVLWLTGCDQMSARAGQDGLDLLVAEATGLDPDVPPFPMRKAFAAAELPHLASTRDTRDRLDLVTENVPVGARAVRADRIIYHPGDTAAPHYHTDCHHVFCVLTGSGLLHAGGEAHRLTAPDTALVGPGEVHWFENDTGENFSFVEFWAPPPTETIWTVTGDRCTWAPAGRRQIMDERQVSMYRRFTWRILSNHVTPWEFEQLKNDITDYEQWCAAWSQHAARHVERGGERIAAEYGGPVTTVIHPDGVHIVDNLWYQARPLVADWLAGTL